MNAKLKAITFRLADIGLEIFAFALMALLVACSVQVSASVATEEGTSFFNVLDRLALPIIVLLKLPVSGIKNTAFLFLIVCAFEYLIIVGGIGWHSQNSLCPAVSFMLTILYFFVLVISCLRGSRKTSPELPSS